MRRIAYLLIIFLVITIIFLGGTIFLENQNGKGALQVTSNSSVQVFLNENFVGETPLCLCDLKKLISTGDYTIKLVPDDKNLQNFEQKITVNKGILTVVDRSFDPKPGFSSGSVITFSSSDNDKAQLLVISSPKNAKVLLDNNVVGSTPLLLNDVTASDHEVKILKDGYSEKIIKIKTLLGKKLEADIILGINTAESPLSSASAKKVTILDTPTGYLRVRKTNSVDSEQIATVNPGDKLDLLNEKEDWYEIRLKNGDIGWVSASYATKE